MREELAALEVELRRGEQRRAGERARLEARVQALAEQVVSEATRAARLREALTGVQDELGGARSELRASEAERRRLSSAVSAADQRSAAQLEAQAELVAVLARDLRRATGDVERVAASRAWRVGHGLARMADRLTFRRRVTEGAVARALDRLAAVQATLDEFSRGGGETASPAPAAAPAAAAAAAAAPEPSGITGAALDALGARIRERLGGPPRRRRWPQVSIVVLNRNGEAHLRRLLAGLTSHTEYPRFELIVVDNDSGDGSRAFLRAAAPPFPLTVIENETNASFSEGNGQGAAPATGDLLLFLNNDVVPFEAGWLRELVAVATRPGIGAAGATLLHGERERDGLPLVQHRGIRMRFDRGRLRAYNVGDGDELFSDRFGGDVASPASTGACLMIARARFEQLGGFPGGYQYGTEDVDLGLQLAAAGEAVVTSGRAHLLHRESATQHAEGREFKRENRLGNQQVFAERWASRLRREYRLDRLRGERYWTEEEGPRIAITLTSLDPADGYGDWYTGHELGDALERRGWRVTYVQRRGEAWYALPDDLDYLLVLLDAYDLRNIDTDALTIAWVRNWTERWLEREWFERYDLVLASSRRTAELVRQRAGLPTVDFPLATNPERFRRVEPDPELAADLVFTGNRWGAARDIQGFRPRPGETLRVFGRGWEDVHEIAPYAAGPLPYDRLPAAYSSASLVIDDTALHALPYGAVNSRVFDALASGTLVVTNGEAGARELFDEEFPTWSDPASLRATLDALAADPDRAAELAARYGRIVRERHTYAHRAAELSQALARAEERLSFCIKAGAPNRRVAAEWGDVHFGEALARELHRRGHRAVVQVLDEWEDAAGLEHDVVVHLKGLSRYTPKPGQFNILWCISHPDELSDEECERYDLVCVASVRFAAALRERISRPVAVLEQATDPRRFYPDPDPRYGHELLFVANSRRVMRRIVADLLPTDHELAVYGTNWSGLIDERYIAGEHVPNAELRRAYSAAAIVLGDHWDDMREHGFVSNRIYDALACGALVVSDDLPELRERFGDAVVTYRDREELRQEIERLLRSPEERSERGRRGREAVLAGYTFEQRAGELLDLVAVHAGATRTIRPSGPAVAPARVRGATGRRGRREDRGRRLAWRR